MVGLVKSYGRRSGGRLVNKSKQRCVREIAETFNAGRTAKCELLEAGRLREAVACHEEPLMGDNSSTVTLTVFFFRPRQPR
jgi:hypothetical protein